MVTWTQICAERLQKQGLPAGNPFYLVRGIDIYIHSVWSIVLCNHRFGPDDAYLTHNQNSLKRCGVLSAQGVVSLCATGILCPDGQGIADWLWCRVLHSGAGSECQKDGEFLHKHEFDGRRVPWQAALSYLSDQCVKRLVELAVVLVKLVTNNLED